MIVTTQFGMKLMVNPAYIVHLMRNETKDGATGWITLTSVSGGISESFRLSDAEFNRVQAEYQDYLDRNDKLAELQINVMSPHMAPSQEGDTK